MLREELLWRDDVDKGWGKRGLSACRYIPRDSLTGFITPVRRKLQVSTLQVLAPQTFSHSGTTSATTSTWYILAGIPVALYLSVFTCREKAYIAMQKEET
ncbi:MAG: hypothetical protein ACO2PM_13810 [Pyrobaculum sp.]